MKWAYGITTVPKRRGDLFPRTLASLSVAGFGSPRIFVDGSPSSEGYANLRLPVTCRFPAIKTYGHWMLSLAELYIREPAADRYAVFQDDFVTSRNLREYLERATTNHPVSLRAYWNLYTFPDNERLAEDRTGFYPSDQRGKGAVALVFTREGVVALLTHADAVNRPQATREYKRSDGAVETIAVRNVDGAVLTSMKAAGFKEYVHSPSLVQHTGEESSMGSRRHPLALSFRGEEFDLLGLLRA